MGIENSTPVVVLRCARHGGLGITRTLGRLGVPVFNVDSERWVPAFKSRYCKGSFKWDVEQSPPRESVGFLQEVARKLGGRPVLIPTTDATATLVADYASELQEHFLFPQRSSELVRSLASKREMYFLAKRFNIPTAETAFPQSRADVRGYTKTASFPIMFKSILTQSGGPKLAKRMFIVHSADELLTHYDQLENGGPPNFMLQE